MLEMMSWSSLLQSLSKCWAAGWAPWGRPAGCEGKGDGVSVVSVGGRAVGAPVLPRPFPGVPPALGSAPGRAEFNLCPSPPDLQPC